MFESGFSGLYEETGLQGQIVITAYFPLDSVNPSPLELFRTLLEEHFGNLRQKPCEILSVESVPVKDWEHEWRKGLSAIEIGSSLVVRPSWVEYDNREERIEIIIDPKMAFGSGGHATTSLCLEAIEDMDVRGLSVTDAGCGSGILSIAAVKLGAASVYGFDSDPFSVQNALENIEINDVGNKIRIEESDLTSVNIKPSDLILANIISGILIANLSVFRSLLNPGGRIVFSGVLAEEEQPFISALQKNDYNILEITRKDEWIAVIAE